MNCRPKWLMLLSMSVVICATSCSRKGTTVSELRRARKDHPEEARQIADRLKETDKGIEFALSDASCVGEGMGGWSSWMLLNSSKSDRVEGGILLRIHTPGVSNAQRIQLLWILWMRTHEGKLLKEIFTMVKNSGGPEVQAGRQLLSTCFSSEDVALRFQVNPSQTLPMTRVEFDACLDEPGAMRYEDLLWQTNSTRNSQVIRDTK